MPEDDIELIEPTEALEEAYLDFLGEFGAAGEEERHGWGGSVGGDFAGFVRRLKEHAKGIGLPAGWVPASTYWLVRGRRVIGACNLRHRLTEALRDFGGHVGYSVRPTERNKGYATLMLGLVLQKARELGICRVLVTCDKNNAASARVIQKNAGVLDSESHSPAGGRVTRRYGVDL